MKSSVVESGQDVEKEYQELKLRPVFRAEGLEGKVFVVDLRSKPGPFHCSDFPLILMEVLERLSFLSRYAVEFRRFVKRFFNLNLPMHSSNISQRFSSYFSAPARQSSFVSAKLINIRLLFNLFFSKSDRKYFVSFLVAR